MRRPPCSITSQQSARYDSVDYLSRRAGPEPAPRTLAEPEHRSAHLERDGRLLVPRERQHPAPAQLRHRRARRVACAREAQALEGRTGAAQNRAANPLLPAALSLDSHTQPVHFTVHERRCARAQTPLAKRFFTPRFTAHPAPPPVPSLAPRGRAPSHLAVSYVISVPGMKKLAKSAMRCHPVRTREDFSRTDV
eukprot:6191241-Pleurochrysis_carterae.AAC.5